MKKNIMTGLDLSHEAKLFRELQDEYLQKFDEEGWSSLFETSRYYGHLADKLENLAWHYDCLANEGVLER